jgi:tetratricopeptide (TPR) repeat protein
VCERFFSSEPVPPPVLTELFAQLHADKAYELAVEGLLAAIRHNQGQPWMYVMLPMEMKLANRPQAEIDRALLSRIDLSSGNTKQTLVTASLLARLRSWDQAIELCKEAIRRDPWQTSVWLKARSIADRSNNPDHIVWSRVGILRYVWTDDSEVHHDEAHLTLQRQLERAQESGPPELASRIRKQIDASRQCDLIVRVEWAGDSDVDLTVKEPGDIVCNQSHQITSNGGVLTRTDQGMGRRHLEEYRCQEAPPGTYYVSVNLIRGRVISGRARVSVTRYVGTKHEEKSTISVEVGRADSEIKIELGRGRGESPQPAQ